MATKSNKKYLCPFCKKETLGKKIKSEEEVVMVSEIVVFSYEEIECQTCKNKFQIKD